MNIENSEVLGSLSRKEELVANAMDLQAANLGYNPNVRLLTKVLRGVTRQKFPIIKISDYVPVEVGQAAWNTNLLKIVGTYNGGDWETGVIEAATNFSRLAETNSAVGTMTYPIVTWAKTCTWTLAQLEQAAATGVYDLIEEAERSRRYNWLLGIQKIAFLGSPKLGLSGILTGGQQPVNTTLIPANGSISSMTPEQFNSFVAGMIAAYSQQVNYTVMPNRLLVPYNDYNGLTSATSPVYPIASKLEYMQKAFGEATGSMDFKILPVFYSIPSMSDGILTKPRYALYRYDPDTLALEIPVDYTPTLANTINGFQLQNVAFGQTAGTCIFRDQEVLYFEPATA